jgi:hypothetical protein
MVADNPLQTAVLNLFVTLKARFPNLVVGQITRESVKKALMNGITAEQVEPPILTKSPRHADATHDRSSPTLVLMPIRRCGNLLRIIMPICYCQRQVYFFGAESSYSRDCARPDSSLGTGEESAQVG